MMLFRARTTQITLKVGSHSTVFLRYTQVTETFVSNVACPGYFLELVATLNMKHRCPGDLRHKQTQASVAQPVVVQTVLSLEEQFLEQKNLVMKHLCIGKNHFFGVALELHTHKFGAIRSSSLLVMRACICAVSCVMSIINRKLAVILYYSW